MAVELAVHTVLAAFGADPCGAHGDHSGHSHSHGHSHNHREARPLPPAPPLSTPQLGTPTEPTSADQHHVGISVDGPNGGPYKRHEPSTPSSTPSSVAAVSRDSAAAVKSTFYDKYVASLKTVQPVAWITAVGDFFHAFTDGVVLAVAFKSCSSSLGWAVMLGIVLHEVPHRVGDFFIFLKAGMLVAQALVVNFLASLASFLGVIILLGAGAVSDHALGVLLTFGSGALLFIAMSELLPPMLAVRGRAKACFHLLWFSLGCVLIGLSKLQDVHCDAETGESIQH